jgi:serine/threonine protein kinase/Cdc6-like AAA superfamily ATPase
MTLCSCGTENLDGTVYCNNCGAQLTTFSNYVPRYYSKSDSRFESLKADLKRFQKSVRSQERLIEERIKRYGSRLRLFFRGHLEPAAVNQSPSPFVKSRKKNPATVPLIRTFRFVHEPVGIAPSSRFIGREGDLNSLAERILFSDGGSFLVTGYRGVGKTSFVNQVIKTLEDALPWAEQTLGRTEIVDVYLNVARPIQPSEMMHHIIRRLHDRLVEKEIYALLDPGLQAALTLAYYRTSVNMARKLAESSERSFGFNEASMGGDWMKAAVKMSWNSKRSSTKNYEISYLGYDDKAAEHDVITIAKGLSGGYIRPWVGSDRWKAKLTGRQPPRIRLKIVFVFDELDKLEEFTIADKSGEIPIIDQILGSLKNLFTTSGVTFVFVAGKDLQERWLDNVGKGDSVYESVFSYDKYLPCLWADVDSMCDQLVERLDGLGPYSRQLYEEFKKYLTYKGRGIPRRIIRTFNEYVEWNDAHPVLAFSRPAVRRIRFFAGLQDVLKNNEKTLFGETHEEIAGTQSDKRRLGIYYLIDWILRQASSEFTLKDVLSASKRLSAKIALAEEVLPEVAGKIIHILLNADYIQEVTTSLNRVVIDKANAIEGVRTVDEKRYRIAPRRLGEIGGLAAEVDLEEAGFAPVIGSTLVRKEKVNSVGRYEFIKLIGRGGMGTVHEAIDTRNGRKVAVKVMLDDTDSDMPRRFKREAIIMSELSHPNVVRLYDWGEEDGQLFIAMEFLEGLTLEELINKQGRLGINLVMAIAKPVAQAAHYIHEKGFVRNDIKPTNIMLTIEGRVCLLDFGVTRPATPNTELKKVFDTERRVIIGTFQFMAPEQIEMSGDQAIDRRADIYSLGVVIYKMLTGVYPFDGAPNKRLAQAQADQDITPPSHLAELPPAIDRVIMKCLEKDLNKRFQTMEELEEALSVAAGEFPAVDLRSLVSIVRSEVNEVQAMDDMATVEPTGLSVPMRIAAPKGAPQRGQSAVLMPREIAIDTLVGEEEKIETSEARDGLSAASSGQHSVMPCIFLIGGRVEEVDFPFNGLRPFPLVKRTRLGRSSDNDLVLRDERLSRYHCQFDVEQGDWFVEDLNSSLGTYVNGEKILMRRFLEEGETIQISDFIFRFNYDNHSADGEPTPS